MTRQVTKIVHISDLHFECPNDKRDVGLERALKANACALRWEEADLILVTGDLTSHGTTITEEFLIAKEWLESLGCPVMVLPGNHDLGANPDRARIDLTSEQYEDVPFADTRFASVFGNETVRIISLDGMQLVGIALRDRDAESTLDGLEQILRNREPTIVFGHYPIAQVRETGPIPWMQPIDEWLGESRKRLVEMLVSSENVIAYCCGHVHASTARLVSGKLMQISAGALGPGPSAYRLYTLRERDLLVETRLACGPLGFWSRFGDVGDSTAEYHLGSDLERRFTLDL